eukprot:11160059-Alexandrium_andersonii.AAC.1
MLEQVVRLPLFAQFAHVQYRCEGGARGLRGCCDWVAKGLRGGCEVVVLGRCVRACARASVHHGSRRACE